MSISETTNIKRDNLTVKTKQINDKLQTIIKDNTINYTIMRPSFKPCLTVADAINKDYFYYCYISNSKMTKIIDQLINKESFVNIGALKNFIKKNHGGMI